MVNAFVPTSITCADDEASNKKFEKTFCRKVPALACLIAVISASAFLATAAMPSLFCTGKAGDIGALPSAASPLVILSRENTIVVFEASASRSLLPMARTTLFPPPTSTIGSPFLESLPIPPQVRRTARIHETNSLSFGAHSLRITACCFRILAACLSSFLFALITPISMDSLYSLRFSTLFTAKNPICADLIAATASMILLVSNAVASRDSMDFVHHFRSSPASPLSSLTSEA
mmetsp:Transcript_19498/g.28319  ORF Transcript_19498/g.28319 Transcript_19498/m.28319 type:complete len:234 (+) Transcript_19498:1492-2193(+)